MLLGDEVGVLPGEDGLGLLERKAEEEVGAVVADVLCHAPDSLDAIACRR